jgi:hypothetical protein
MLKRGGNITTFTSGKHHHVVEGQNGNFLPKKETTLFLIVIDENDLIRTI